MVTFPFPAVDNGKAAELATGPELCSPSLPSPPLPFNQSSGPKLPLLSERGGLQLLGQQPILRRALKLGVIRVVPGQQGQSSGLSDAGLPKEAQLITLVQCSKKDPREGNALLKEAKAVSLAVPTACGERKGPVPASAT